jgi:GTPase SAR1 family protein
MIYVDKKPEQKANAPTKGSDTIKICFLGDKQVGKSSLISKIKGNAKAEPAKTGGKQLTMEDSVQSSYVNSPDVVTQYFKFPFTKTPVKTRLWD